MQIKCPKCDSNGINYVTDDACRYCKGTSKIEACEMRKQLMAAFPNLTEADFHRHESDLYVVDQTGEISKWLKANYVCYSNIQRFTGAKGSAWEGKLCLDIPFVAMVELHPDMAKK